ncbi:MAG: hypothetical protein IT352_17105 [Gemmatimonadales bacterium]|nr:hypothetical protein [Gemmatimonadales bacterium]
MSWDRLDVHIENLMPGLATLFAALAVSLQPIVSDATSDTGYGILLVGAAYIVGVLANTAGRLLFDPASEYLSRPWIFRLFGRDKLGGLRLRTKNKAVNDAYNFYCRCGIQGAEAVAREVAKRRQTARLLRSAFVPIATYQILLARQHSTLSAGTTGAVVITYVVLLALYGYAEVTILHEAFHSVPVALRDVDAIQRRLVEDCRNDQRGSVPVMGPRAGGDEDTRRVTL